MASLRTLNSAPHRWRERTQEKGHCESWKVTADISASGRAGCAPGRPVAHTWPRVACHSLGTPPAGHRLHLPQPLTPFVNRQRELRAVRPLLLEQRLLSLVGPAGIGKTRLGLELAANVEKRFSAGPWFVELASLTAPDMLPRLVARCMGIEEDMVMRLGLQSVYPVSPGTSVLCEHFDPFLHLPAGTLCVAVKGHDHLIGVPPAGDFNIAWHVRLRHRRL